MEEKISIIIPVYKVEQYLPKCLESVIGQTYRNLEIILIDDGSPDESGKICDAYAQKDNRIHVIHKKNGGVASARNDGIEYAGGEYISFIDSDDWVAEDAYMKLYRGLKQYDADCCVGGCVKAIERDESITLQKNVEKQPECRTREETVRDVLLHGSAVWNRLFKREIFSAVRFPKDRINDDEVAALHAYMECNKIVFLNQDTYYYRIRPDSITTSAFSIRKVDCYYNSLDNLVYIRQKMPKLGECAEYKVIKTMLYSYINLRKCKDEPVAVKVREELRRDICGSGNMALKNGYVPLYMKFLVVLIQAVSGQWILRKKVRKNGENAGKSD